jgi:hypothetical protein
MLSGILCFKFAQVAEDVRKRRPIVPMLRPNSYWDAACTQFWPSDGFPIDWPPPKYFNDASLDEFINRLQHPIDLYM